MLIALCLHSPGVSSADDPNRCKAPAGTRPFEFTDGENLLRGFIEFPTGVGPHGGVLILHGSGDTDVFHRDSFYNGRYELLRQTFREAGVATVVWDKAGNGCSTGGYPHGNPIRERAGEAVAALRALQQRGDIDAARLGLWGISQGGWIAPMAAVRADVRFLILVSSPAGDAVSQLKYQAVNELRARGVGEPALQIAEANLARAFAIMRAGGTVDEFVAAVAPLQGYPSLRDLGITKGTPEDYIKWQNTMDFHYRPDTALRELRQPVLALFGDRDVLIDWRESVRIYRESFRLGRNSDLTIKVLKNAGHNLTTESGSLAVEGYLPTMREWLKRNAGKPRHAHVARP